MVAATVVVEAGEGSGTRRQGWEALRLGRPLYFVESAVKSGDIRWINEQIDYGAEILTDQNVPRSSTRSRPDCRFLHTGSKR